MAYAVATLPDGRKRMSDGTIQEAPNSFSSGAPVSNISPTVPGTPQLPQVTGSFKAPQPQSNFGTPVGPDLSNIPNPPSQGGQSDQGIGIPPVPGQPQTGQTETPEIIYQVTSDILKGMPAKEIEKIYPELKGGDLSVFSQLASDVQAGMPAQEAPKHYPELFPQDIVQKVQQPQEVQPNNSFADNFKMKSSENFGVGENLKDVGKFFVNLPADSAEVVGGLWHAVTNPIDTVEGMVNIGMGLSDKAVFKIANSISSALGGPTAGPTQNEEMVNVMGTYIKDEYGTAGKFKKALVENPADTLLTLMGGLGTVKQIAVANNMTNIANNIDKINAVINPINILKKEGQIVAAPFQYGKTKIGENFSKLQEKISSFDAKTKEAIANTAPEDMRAIIDNAKESVGTQGDYVQTPYHKGAEKADQVLTEIDKNLGMRQNERMAVLETAPIESIKLDAPREALANGLKKMNVEDILVDDAGQVRVVPVEGRESMFQADNPSDIKAMGKLQEILQDDASPLQTMDRVKKLQEWVYENKSRIGFKGVSDKMEGLLSKVQTSMNKTFKEQLPEEYAKIMDSMSEDIKLQNDMKRVFGIDEFGNTIGNRGELVMKRLANGTTTGGEARTLALKIKEKYGIDLIKEARLRQMAMELVGDDRAKTFFGALQKGKGGIMNYLVQKGAGLIQNDEKVAMSLAKGKKEVIKDQVPLTAKERMKQSRTPKVEVDYSIIPGAKKTTKEYPYGKTTRIGFIEKAPEGGKVGILPERTKTTIDERTNVMKETKQDIASSTNAARYGGTGEQRIRTSIDSAMKEGAITREEAQMIVSDILESVTREERTYSYTSKKGVEDYLNDLYSANYKPKIESFDEIVSSPGSPSKQVLEKLSHKQMLDIINKKAGDRRFSKETIDGIISEFKKETGKDPLDVSYDDFGPDGMLKKTPEKKATAKERIVESRREKVTNKKNDKPKVSDTESKSPTQTTTNLSKSKGGFLRLPEIGKKVPKELQPLAEEAKKYKSAEEFSSSLRNKSEDGSVHEDFDKYDWKLTSYPIGKITPDMGWESYMSDSKLKAYITKMAKDIKNGDNIPPVMYDATDGYILNGNHRLLAYKKAGYKNIPVLLTTGKGTGKIDVSEVYSKK